MRPRFVHGLADDWQPGLATRECEQLEFLFAAPLERVGRDGRLVRAGAEGRCAGRARTAHAVVLTWCSYSSEHGPAITTTSLPPTRTPGAIVTTVCSGRHSRDT